MVINIGALKSRDYETVFEDICRVVKSSAPAGVKVILETSALDTRAEDHRLHAVQARGRGVREDVDRLRQGRRDRRGRRS